MAVVHRTWFMIHDSRVTGCRFQDSKVAACTTRERQVTRDSQDDAGNATPPAGPGLGSASGSQIFQRWPEAEEKREMDAGRWTLDAGRWTLTIEH